MPKVPQQVHGVNRALDLAIRHGNATLVSPTSNVPLVTVNALVAPVDVKQVPLPENDPVALVDVIVASVTDPLDSVQTKLKLVSDCVAPRRNRTSVHGDVVQFALTVEVPAVVRAIVITAISQVVDVFGTAAAMSVSPAVAVEPAAHCVEPNDVLGLAGTAPLALYVVADVAPAPV